MPSHLLRSSVLLGKPSGIGMLTWNRGNWSGDGLLSNPVEVVLVVLLVEGHAGLALSD